MLAGWLLASSARAQAVIYSANGSLPGEQLGLAASVIGDVDGDGFSDAFVQSYLPFNVPLQVRSFVLSGRTGTFFQTTINAECIGTVGDLDGDGVRDVAIRYPGLVEVHSPTTGYFIVSLPGSFSLSDGHDLNLDGVPELLAYDGSDRLRVHSGTNGVELFQVQGSGGIFGEIRTPINDFNGDGTPELLIGSTSSQPGAKIGVYSGLNGSQLALLPIPAARDVTAVGDLNGDGHTELALAPVGSDVVILDGISFTTLRSFPGTSNASRLSAVGDMDLDGELDLVVLESANGLPTSSWRFRIYSCGSGLLTTSASGQPGEGTPATIVGGGDFNRDGFPDLLVGSPLYSSGASSYVGRVAVYSGAATPATTFCQAKQNSLGCTPFAWAAGSSSLTGPDNLTIHSARVISNKLGLMFWGRQPNSAPFLGGTLCISTPFQRAQNQNSGGSASGDDCTGAFAVPFTHAMMTQNGLTPGAAIYCQFWHRDPGFPPPSNVGLSNGVRVTISF